MDADDQTDCEGVGAMNDNLIPASDSGLSDEYSVPNIAPDGFLDQFKDAKIIHGMGDLKYFMPLVELMAREGWVITEIGGISLQRDHGPELFADEQWERHGSETYSITVFPKKDTQSQETFYMCRYGHYDPVFVMTYTDRRTNTRCMSFTASVVELIPLRDLLKRVEADVDRALPDGDTP